MGWRTFPADCVDVCIRYFSVSDEIGVAVSNVISLIRNVSPALILTVVIILIATLILVLLVSVKRSIKRPA